LTTPEGIFIVRGLGIHSRALPAPVVKLVDTPASGAGGRKAVEVQVLSWAPNSKASIAISGLFHLQLRLTTDLSSVALVHPVHRDTCASMHIVLGTKFESLDSNIGAFSFTASINNGLVLSRSCTSCTPRHLCIHAHRPGHQI
jgi:hypothetical protein